MLDQRRAALHHRPERRRQDHADGRDHRQDPARRRAPSTWTARPHELTTLTEYEIAQLGIGRKFQRPTVFQGHTVFENLELALRGRKRRLAHACSRGCPAPQRARIDEVLETIGLQRRIATGRAGLLSHGQKQWLEIGMLLAQDPKVLLVDEPVAGMTHQEMERTAELLQRLAGERTVVVVEHDMEFVRSIARKVTVLHEGRVLAEGTMDEVQSDPQGRSKSIWG